MFSESHTSIPLLKSVSTPSSWSEWFWSHRPSTVVYVQDVVHIAVKLKSRLIKPSVLLPMCSFVAGVHHLQILQIFFVKDVHGLRERDIARQNVDAVLHIVRALSHLDKLPDVAATKEFIVLIQCVIDSYLDKGIDPLSRIEKIWYATFLLRYWHQWILQHSNYTLQNNFITQNAYFVHLIKCSCNCVC